MKLWKVIYNYISNADFIFYIKKKTYLYFLIFKYRKIR